MAQQPIPQAIRTWLDQLNWGDHHLQWHIERRWDRFAASDVFRPPNARVIPFALSQGWTRYPVQEGAASNGVEFLAMHRAMILALRKTFPQHRDIFDGWPRVPTEPNDANNPVPPNPNDPESTLPLAIDLSTGADRIHDNPGSFLSDDELGIFIQTTDRPTLADPLADSDDPGAGLHNYLHGRFTDPGDNSISMGNPQVNIFNTMFWRLHGWIDTMWGRYRAATGKSDAEPGYIAALRTGARHMGVENIVFPAPHHAAGGAAAKRPARAAHGGHDHGGHDGHHGTTPIQVPPAVMKSILALIYACPPRPSRRVRQGIGTVLANVNFTPPTPNISAMNACIADSAEAYSIVDKGPKDETNISQLRSRVTAARSNLPPAYRGAIAEPFSDLIEDLTVAGFNSILANDPGREGAAGALLDVSQAIIQRGERYRHMATRAFQEIISDLYDGFLSAEDREDVKPPDEIIIAPLVKWGLPDFGPYTWTVEALSDWDIKTGVVHLPASHSHTGLMGWATLPHELNGHNILDADDGLKEELEVRVHAALLKAKLPAHLASYWSTRIDETASDVLGILNMGPAPAIGMIAYFRGLRSIWEQTSAELSNQGAKEDSHPADLLRGYLGASTVRLLDFSTSKAWADVIKKETDKDHTAINLEGIKVSQAHAVKSAQIVAETIATVPLDALEGHALIEVQNWRNNDEAITHQIRQHIAGIDGATLPDGAYATHVVAAAISFALEKGNPAAVLRRAVEILAAMNVANPSWGPLFVRSRGDLVRHRTVYKYTPRHGDQPAMAAAPGEKGKPKPARPKAKANRKK
ncbi:hypothetical protein [Roseimicrobium sp. ORNL1]|uniref:hypothetical protein n=1 Tax=Roseimicrobium sp. ORNL1 TaxID=2711231 RepID=UPI001980AD6E|nr:hypothetical protein [Roseimicrobium sp. ORNL1]